MTDFGKLNVLDLKKYLQNRGISCSLHRKDRLIKLCECAEELELEEIAPDDYKTLNHETRTVLNDKNEKILLKSVTEISDSEWSNVLNSLQDMTQCDLLIYLMQINYFSEDKLRNYKTSNGYRLYGDNHIHLVQLYNFQEQPFTYVRGRCTPETRQSEKPYMPWTLMKNNGQIWSGGCTCVVDNGTCKHVAALLFALEDFSTRHKDRHTEVCTDTVCTWDKSRKPSKPTKINELKTRGNMGQDKLEPISTNYTATAHITYSDSDLVKKMKDVCKGHNSVFLHTIDDSSDSDEDECEPQTMQQLAEQASRDNVDFSELLKTYHDNDIINEIEEITRGQSNNINWFKYKCGRITASNFHSVLHFGFNKDNNYILNNILQKKSVTTEAMSYGINHEPIARNLYFRDFKSKHNRAKLSECGIFISKTRPYMGASPDGLVSCKCCGTGLLEIKCCFAYKDIDPYEICKKKPKYHLKLEKNNKVCLKRSSAWFSQIQGQMGICGYQFCDFVLYTEKSFSVEHISFDEEFFSGIVKKCEKFFHEYIVKSLCDK